MPRNREEEHHLMTKWSALAPIVFAYFNIDEEHQKIACVAARRSPRNALACYRSIVNSLTWVNLWRVKQLIQ